MSFILDALKKSETERQRQGGTEFTVLPVSPASSSVPRWLWIVGALLMINLFVLVGLLLRPDAGPSQLPVATIETSRPTPEVANDAESSFEQKVAAAKQRPPVQQASDSTADVTSPSSPPVQSVLISQNPAEVPASDRYPTLQEVQASGTSHLPDLHLDIHVYSAVPKDRFVFINMTKLREGSQLAEGPVVAEITPDGVVLGHQGQYFLLPRD